MNKAEAVKTLTRMREEWKRIETMFSRDIVTGQDRRHKYRREIAALSVAINALTGKTAKRRKGT